MINASLNNASQALSYLPTEFVGNRSFFSLPQSGPTVKALPVVKKQHLPINFLRFPAGELERHASLSKQEYKIYLVTNEPSGVKKSTPKAFQQIKIVPPGETLPSIPETNEVIEISFEESLLVSSAISSKFTAQRKILSENVVWTFDLTARDSKVLEKITYVIADELAQGHPEMSEMITIKLLEILILCEGLTAQVAEPVSLTEKHPIIVQFNRLVDRNYTKERSVRYYADALGIHPNHLNYLVKKHTMANAKECINSRVLQRSKQLLSQSGLIIKEIAYQLGFDDPNNFSTFFQKYAGISPVAFRSNVSGQFYA